MKRSFALILILAACNTACQPRLLWWRQSPESYAAAVETWTCSGHVYQGMKTVISVYATYMHPAVRAAYVRRKVADHRLSEEEAAELAARQEKAEQEGLEFIVNLFSDEDIWKTLEGEDSIWTITLLTATGKRIAPLKTEYFKQVPIYIQTYFPNIKPFGRVYRLVFPRTYGDEPLSGEDTRRIRLEILSAAAQVTLSWQLR